MASPPPGPGVASSLRRLLAHGLALLQVRLELLGVETRDEADRLLGLFILAALAVVFLGLGFGFLAILITVALWDSHRLLALAVFATLFITLGGVAAFAARARAGRGSRMFEASLGELRDDLDRLGS